MFESDWDGGEGAARRYKKAENIYLREKIKKHQEIEKMKEENAMLKDSNRAMMVALKDIRKIVYKARHYEIDHDDRTKLIKITGDILAKAEGKRE